MPKMLSKGIQIFAVLNCIPVYSSPSTLLLKSQANMLICERGPLHANKNAISENVCKSV